MAFTSTFLATAGVAVAGVALADGLVTIGAEAFWAVVFGTWVVGAALWVIGFCCWFGVLLKTLAVRIAWTLATSFFLSSELGSYFFEAREVATAATGAFLFVSALVAWTAFGLVLVTANDLAEYGRLIYFTASS